MLIIYDCEHKIIIMKVVIYINIYIYNLLHNFDEISTDEISKDK